MLERILIVAHGHPAVHKGGAEIAAFQMYEEYAKQGFDVKFLARSPESPHGGAAFSARNTDKELLFHTTHDDFFLFSNLKTRYLWAEFRELLLRFKPQVVHFHHFFLLGIETILEVKNTLPDCKIILTLHEYLAICNNKGLMLKTNSNRLCNQASPKDCHLCFPEHSPADFFMREKYLKRGFSAVSHFISPSKFLKQRYEDWGVDPEKITVIENGQQTLPDTNSDYVSISDKPIRVAFFGQINPFKGVDVLLDALNLAPKAIRTHLRIDIHGANLEVQSKKFIKKVKSLLKQNAKYATFHGAYESEHLGQLMSEADWVVVPSIWWENSPLVIQEAFNYKVPVIVSDIGGMAEKVHHGLNGLHFRAGNASSLSSVLCKVVLEADKRQDYVNNISPPLTVNQTTIQTLAIYQQC